MVKTTYIILAVLGFSACNSLRGKDEVLRLQQKPFLEKSLNLNGCYVRAQPNIYHEEIYFLFRNGVIKSYGSVKMDSIYGIQELLKDSIIEKKVRESKFSWGVFNVAGDSIFIEMWEPTGGALITLIQKGIIIDDTTFVIQKVTRPLDNSTWPMNEVYHFKKFSPKPDSTNDFIK